MDTTAVWMSQLKINTGNYHITKTPQCSIYRQYHFSGADPQLERTNYQPKWTGQARTCMQSYLNIGLTALYTRLRNGLAIKRLINYGEEINHIGVKLHSNNIKLVTKETNKPMGYLSVILFLFRLLRTKIFESQGLVHTKGTLKLLRRGFSHRICLDLFCDITLNYIIQI